MKINNLGIFLDAEGNQYILLEKIKQIAFRPLNGAPTIRDGSRQYETACGIPVNVENGAFVTWDDVILTPEK